MVEYTVIRSRRKTAGIYILPGGRIEVRCPLGFSDSAAAELVRQKQKWIEKHLHAMQSQKQKALADKTTLLWGAEYPILEGENFGFDKGIFHVFPEKETECLQKIYQQLAEDVIPARALKAARKTGIIPASVQISAARSYWGICTGKNQIRFSRRIVMLPMDVVDYIIIHELAHCREHNHGQGFWKVVERFIPDYVIKRRKLREIERLILSRDWIASL